jgi:hypothetical protein
MGSSPVGSVRSHRDARTLDARWKIGAVATVIIAATSVVASDRLAAQTVSPCDRSSKYIVWQRSGPRLLVSPDQKIQALLFSTPTANKDVKIVWWVPRSPLESISAQRSGTGPALRPVSEPRRHGDPVVPTTAPPTTAPPSSSGSTISTSPNGKSTTGLPPLAYSTTDMAEYGTWWNFPKRGCWRFSVKNGKQISHTWVPVR